MPFALARGRRALEDAIAQFRAESAVGNPASMSEGTRTLLLLVKQGANGLNLTGAHAHSSSPTLPSVLSQSNTTTACCAYECVHLMACKYQAALIFLFHYTYTSAELRHARVEEQGTDQCSCHAEWSEA